MFSLTVTPKERVEAFHKRFEPLYGEGHLLFACHAAYPVMLTPDLLYQLWYNFRHYVDDAGKSYEMAPVVVNDFIHSGLCKPLSKGLYSVEDELRVFLLEKLIAREGEGRVRQLAHFLQAWLAQPEAHVLRKSTRQLHEWVIGATLDPGGAAKAVTEALSENLQKGNRRENKRIYHVINSLKEHSSAFEELFQYAEKLAEQIQRQEGENVVLPAISFEEQEGIDLVKMPLTEALREKIGRKQEAKTDPEVFKRIEEAKASGGKEIDLSNLSLTALPPELSELKDLESLNLEGNSLVSIPIGLHHFPKLHTLNLASCNIFYLNLRLLDCPGLKRLNLDDNEITFIPGHIEQLKQLEYFSAKYNPIEYVPGSMGSLPLKQIIIPDHRLETVPLGWKRLINYWEELQSQEKQSSYFGGLEEAEIELDFGSGAFGNSDPSATPARQLDYALSYSRGYFDGLNFAGKNRIVAIIAGTDHYLSSQVQDVSGSEAECAEWADWLQRYIPEERLELRMAVGPEQCTKRGVIEALTRLSLEEGDQLVFIFTGYGARQYAPPALQPYYEEGMMSSLICSDSRAGDSDLFGIELEAIFSVASEQKARVTVITDASHSASLWRISDDFRRKAELYTTNSIDPKEFFFVQGAEHRIYQEFAQASFEEADGPLLPELVHFAASQPHENAMMISRKDKGEIGVYNQSLFKAFERIPWMAKITEVASRASLQTMAHMKNQMPALLRLDDMQKDRVLFGQEQNTSFPHLMVYFDHSLKAWVLNAGAIHGIPQHTQGRITLYLFDEFYKADRPEYALAEVEVTKVETTRCLLGKTLNHINKDLIFRALFKEYPHIKLNVYESEGLLSVWTKRDTFQLRECWEANFIDDPEEFEDINGDGYDIVIEKGEFHWVRTQGSTDAIVSLESPYTKAGDIGREVKPLIDAVAHCERLLKLENNLESGLEAQVEAVIELQREGASESEPVPLENLTEFYRKGDEKLTGTLSIKNKSDKRLYISLLIIDYSTSIYAPREHAVALFPLESLEISDIELHEVPNDVFWLKLLIATEPFSVTFWLQDNRKGPLREPETGKK